MDIAKLKGHIEKYKQHLATNPEKLNEDLAERKERCDYYRSMTREKILAFTEEEFLQYLAKLWAMRIWENKKYVIDKMIADNGFDPMKAQLAEFVWGSAPVDQRWDAFKDKVVGFGPAMMSEILCHVYPETCMLWNRRAYVGLDALGVKNLPRHNYQMTGKKYAELSGYAQKIADEMKAAGVANVTLLTVDYFIWDELQVVDNLSKLHEKTKPGKVVPDALVVPEVTAVAAQDKTVSTSFHNEIRDKIVDIGGWQGFVSSKEKKVAEGSKVDAIWEFSIANMGRVIYVFEVQTSGSIDSLIINLLKALNNPAVQGVVAVSDATQLERIVKHAREVPNLGNKLKTWDCQDVLKVHASLELANESINRLGLVPQGF